MQNNLESNSIVESGIYSYNKADFKIIKSTGKRIVIEWLDDHSRQEVSRKAFINGRIKRFKRETNVGIEPGTILPSMNYGDFEVVELVKTKELGRHYKIRFLNTGYEKIVRGTDMISKNVKDNYLRTIFGVACHGDIPKEINCRNTRVSYRLWYNMLTRCYDHNSKDYNAYGGSGVRVCDRWLIYSNFLEDIVFIPGYNEWVLNPSEYNLDKDYLQIDIPDNKKIYALHTCIFIKNSYNFILANLQRYYKFGVFKEDGVFKAVIVFNGTPISLGAYPAEEMATAAYINAFRFYTGYIPITNIAPCDINEICGKNLEAKVMCTSTDNKV